MSQPKKTVKKYVPTAKEKQNLKDATEMKNMRPTGPKGNRIPPTNGGAKNGTSIKKAQNSVASDTLSTKKNYETSPYAQAKEDKSKKLIEYKKFLMKYEQDERFNKNKEAMKNKKRAGGAIKKAQGGALEPSTARIKADQQKIKDNVNKIQMKNAGNPRVGTAKSGGSMKTCKGGC